MGSLGSPLRAICRIISYLGCCFVLVPAQIVLLALGLPARMRLPIVYHRWCCRAVGIRIEVHGAISTHCPTVFVANHSSYLDIMILGSLISGSFVAKAEVAGWPLFGLLAKLQRTVFVVREPRHAVAQRDEMGDRLADGDNLILFPEGTSSDGTRVLPFKSALLSVAEQDAGGRPVHVQPVSVAYTRLDGMPIGRGLRPFFAWYGGMDLAGHVWQFAGLGRTTVEVHFHPVVTLAELGSRKAVARYCHERVAHGLSVALSGRPLEAPVAA